MATPNEYMKKILQLRARIVQESERIIYRKADEITAMNIQKIDAHKGSDGQILRNINRKYSGLYQPLTVEIAKTENPIRPKVLGHPYNWRWNGDFMSGFEIKVSENATKIDIYSVGEGSGLKKDFFDGYKNLYGLTKADQYKLNYEIIYEPLMKFINQYI